jgi:hypothetical protein
VVVSKWRLEIHRVEGRESWPPLHLLPTAPKHLAHRNHHCQAEQAHHIPEPSKKKARQAESTPDATTITELTNAPEAETTSQMDSQDEQK